MRTNEESSHRALAFNAAVPRNLRLPLRRQRPMQTIRDQEPTLGHRKKLPAGTSEPAPAPVGPSSTPNILTAEEGTGRGEFSTGALAFRGVEGLLGERRSRLYAQWYSVPTKQKGRRRSMTLRPYFPSPAPPGSAIATMKLRLG